MFANQTPTDWDAQGDWAPGANDVKLSPSHTSLPPADDEEESSAPPAVQGLVVDTRATSGQILVGPTESLTLTLDETLVLEHHPSKSTKSSSSRGKTSGNEEEYDEVDVAYTTPLGLSSPEQQPQAQCDTLFQTTALQFAKDLCHPAR